jgi:hypothetical protein
MAGEVNPQAFEVGQLAQRLVDSYLAHVASNLIARDPRSAALVPPVEPDQDVPIGRLLNGDGTPSFEFNFESYLAKAVDDSIAAEFDRTFAAGALLALGDALAGHGYFDRAPQLELVKHLRNGVAHGNRFNIRYPAQLTAHPATNAHAEVKTSPILEITPGLNGQVVLFDFLAPADVVGVLQGVSAYLIRMGNGDALY